MKRWTQANWESVRKRGRSRFIWRDAVLCFGLPLALALMGADLLEYLIGAGPAIHWKHAIVSALLIVAVCGPLFGALLWASREREFRKRQRTS